MANCPMCGEVWNEQTCGDCGWSEAKDKPVCRCGHERDDHGSRTEQRDGQKVYVQKCEHCPCEVFTDRAGPLSKMLDEFKPMRADAMLKARTEGRWGADMAEHVCHWSVDDVGGDSVYETDCKHTFEFNDGGPHENGFLFCGYCGRQLVESRTSEDEPDEPAHT